MNVARPSARSMQKSRTHSNWVLLVIMTTFCAVYDLSLGSRLHGMGWVEALRSLAVVPSIFMGGMHIGLVSLCVHLARGRLSKRSRAEAGASDAISAGR